MQSDSGHAWRFRTPHGELCAGVLSGQIDVSRPELGINQLALERQPLSGRLFGVQFIAPEGCSELPLSDEALLELPSRHIADSYVRGCDLVATYQPTEAWPYATQVYWQVCDAANLPAVLSSISLLVSLQTHLLDTWPTMSINTQLVADEVIHLQSSPGHQQGTQELTAGMNTLRATSGFCCVLYRLTGVPITYVELMPASDLREVAIWRGSDRTCRARWDLFAEFLEKGVIRRARMQSIVVPRASDTELARAFCGAMEHQPLPLTT